MQKVNSFFAVLTAAFFVALLTTPLSAQVATRQGTLTTTTTSPTKTTTTTVDVVEDQMKAMLDTWEKYYNAEKSAELEKLLASKVTITEPDGDSKVMTKTEFVGNLQNDFIDPGVTEVDLNVTSVFVQPDGKAVVVGTYTERQLDAGGTVVSRKSGDFMDVLTKESGAWKIEEITVRPD